MAYAENTTVDSIASRAEIERTLRRYGATSFQYGTRAGVAMVAFEAQDRQVRFVIPLPDPNDRKFTLTPTGKRASPGVAEKNYEQAVRQKWRALALVVKAKLEAVESNISTFEQEFMANIVLPDGSTVYENVSPAIARAYETGRVTSLLQIEG